MSSVTQWELRAAFAQRLSAMYGKEVPAYTTLLDVSQRVNMEVVGRDAELAQRLGSIERVTSERHGAIRVGTPAELSQVARVFGALGMHPVGFYDLRDAAKSAVPVISTAFRPIEMDELALNPFRVFTSMLVTNDRRFFSADLQTRAENFLARRSLFSPRLLELADRAGQYGELPADDAEEFLLEAVGAFKISDEPVDRAWYAELEAVSAVAADIAGVRSTHINHLTPRVLDIDELYLHMESEGISMIDDIQGPPRFEGPDVLLRQTSFRALAEPRVFRQSDGSVATGSLRVRFGEVEARGIAVTPEGRAAYERANSEIDEATAQSDEPRSKIAAGLWSNYFPSTEQELLEGALGYFTFRPGEANVSPDPDATAAELVALNALIADPIVYEDFLPRSAAGIFQSNLSDAGSKDQDVQGTDANIDSLSEAVEKEILDPDSLYLKQSLDSLSAARRKLR